MLVKDKVVGVVDSVACFIYIKYCFQQQILLLTAISYDGKSLARREERGDNLETWCVLLLLLLLLLWASLQSSAFSMEDRRVSLLVLFRVKYKCIWIGKEEWHEPSSFLENTIERNDTHTNEVSPIRS